MKIKNNDILVVQIDDPEGVYSGKVRKKISRAFERVIRKYTGKKVGLVTTNARLSFTVLRK